MPEGDTIFRTATVLRRALGGRQVLELRSSVPQVSARAGAVAGRTVSAVESRGKHLLITFAVGDGRGSRVEVARSPQEGNGAGRARPLDADRTVAAGDHTSAAMEKTVVDRASTTSDARGAPADALGGSFADIAAREPTGPDLVLHTHLGMHGSWHVYRAGQPWRVPERLAALVVVTDSYVAPCFRPAVAALEPTRAVERSWTLRSLGPDAITPGFDAAEARRRLRSRDDVEIGVALLDQRAIAGLGNVYKSEVLFIRRVSPFARVGELSDTALDGRVAAAHRLLVRNAGGGARRTVPGAGPRDGLWVYRRSGRPCRICGGRLAMRRQGTDGRSTYYCPTCQGVSMPAPAVRRIGRE